jgi:TPR repeat protein
LNELERAAQRLRAGHEHQALEIYHRLASAGDGRAAAALGFIYEAKGRGRAEFYSQAAQWYEQALRRIEDEGVRLGLARIFYYGLDGRRNLKLAREHLVRAAPDRNVEASLMLGELKLLGAGTSRDIPGAKSYFLFAAQQGYPLGLLGLARIARREGHFVRAFWLAVRHVAASTVLMVRNRRDPRLLGVGRFGGRLVLEGQSGPIRTESRAR